MHIEKTCLSTYGHYNMSLKNHWQTNILYRKLGRIWLFELMAVSAKRSLQRRSQWYIYLGTKQLSEKLTPNPAATIHFRLGIDDNCSNIICKL